MKTLCVELVGSGSALGELGVEEFDGVRAGGAGFESGVGTGRLCRAFEICGGGKVQKPKGRFVGGKGFVSTHTSEEEHEQTR